MSPMAPGSGRHCAALPRHRRGTRLLSALLCRQVLALLWGEQTNCQAKLAAVLDYARTSGVTRPVLWLVAVVLPESSCGTQG